MFNLDVSTDKLADLKKLFNDANVHHRIAGKSADGLITTIRFKEEADFEKAKQLVNVGVVAQGNLIHASPFLNVSIGDYPIDWVADDGSPTTTGATL